MRIINGYLVIWWADGSRSAIFVPSLIFLLLIAVIVLWLIWFLIRLCENSTRRYQVSYYVPQAPAEIVSPESAENYRQQTERLVELKNKLDAETQLTESYIRAMRAKAELDELPKVFARTGEASRSE